MQIPISALLREEILHDFILLTGENNLEQLINTTACLDCPDGLGYLHGNEFILTSGYILAEDPALQLSIIEECHRRGIAALGIDRRFFSIPSSQQMLTRARDLQVPVLSIPETFSFESIHHFFSDHYYSSIKHEIKKKYEVIKDFNEALEKDSFQGIVKLLHEWTGHVAVICTEMGALDYVYPPVRVDNASLAEMNSHMRTGTQFFIPADESNRAAILGHKLIYDGNVVGLICLYNDQGSPFSSDDEELLSVADGICVNELKRNNDILTLRYDQAHSLVLGMIDGTLQEKQAVDLARTYGYHLQDEYRLAIMNLGSPLMAVFFPVLWRYFFRQGILAMMPNSHSFLLLIPVTWATFDEHAFLEGVNALAEQPNSTILFSPCIPYNELPATYRKAKHVDGIGRMLFPEKRLLHFEDIGVYLLFDIEANGRQYADLLAKYIAPLLTHQEHELLETAYAFVRRGYNYTHTAQSMFLHSNTIRYRISVIEKLLGISLKNQQQRYTFETALLLNDISAYLQTQQAPLSMP